MLSMKYHGIIAALMVFISQKASTRDTCTVFGAVQLFSGSIPSEGIVEFCDGFHWGKVCTDGWDANDAAVVCKELGYTADDALYLRYSYQYGIDFVIMGVTCTSAEARLSDCAYLNGSYCSMYRLGAGVRCRAFKYVNVTINRPQDTVYSVLITWEYHRHNNTSRQLTNFKVECFSKQHNISYISVDSMTSRASIGGLLPFTSYNCCVSSIYYGYSGRSYVMDYYTAEKRCILVIAMDSLTIVTVDAVTTVTPPTEIVIPPQQSGDSNMNNNDMRVNIISGALGFVIVILLLLLAICGGALLYLLRSKSVIPKRSTSSQPRSTEMPILSRNISYNYLMAPSTSGAQAIDTIDQTSAAEYSRIGPSYEAVVTANSSHSRRQQPVSVGGNQHSARLSERYEFSEPHLAMISVGGGGGTQGQAVVPSVDYEVSIQSGEHEEYSHLQH